MTRTLKASLLEIAKNTNWHMLSQWFQNQRKRKSNVKPAIQEALEEFSRQEQQFLWESAFTYCSQMIAKLSENHGNEHEQHVSGITSIVHLMNANCEVLSSVKEPFVPEKLVELALFWGNLVPDLEDPLQKYVLKFCENWILTKRDEYHEIVPNVLKLLIKKTLTHNSMKQCVKLVWNFNEGLDSILNEENSEICESVISCATSPAYLSCTEGIKFVGLLLSKMELISRIHLRVKADLPSLSKKQSITLGEIYFRAWKISTPNVKKFIEEDCIQDFMHSAVHIEPQTVLSNNLFTLLSYIHMQKKHIPTAAMIYSLYEPFIWRSLNAANGYVRLNAVKILSDAFPFTENKSKGEEDNLQARQYQVFLQLLVDPCHLVRIGAIKGAFNVLFQFWRLIPSNTIQEMFQLFLRKLLSDASCSEVRAAVIDGITMLLDCAEAIPFMTNILPKTADTFDDVNGNVRLAYAKLLLKVDSTRFVRYWTIVPMEHLLLRIGEDSSTRSVYIKLVRNSFMPINQSEKEWLTRAISFLEIDRNSARHFYQTICKQLDVESSTKFIISIWRTISRYVALMNDTQNSMNDTNNLSDSSLNDHGGQTRRNSGSSKKTSMAPKNNKENLVPQKTALNDTNTTDSIKGDGSVVHLPLKNPEITSGLIDIMIIMWTVNSGQLSLTENLKYLDALRTRISKSFPTVWSFFKDEQPSSSLLYLSSFIPARYVSTMPSMCMSKLKSAKEPIENVDSLNLYLVAMCNWNRVDDVIEIIDDWLQKTFLHPKKKISDQKNVRKVRFKPDTDNPKPLLGLSYLKFLLKHRLNRLCLLEKNRSLLIKLADRMSTVVDAIRQRLEKGCELSKVCTDEFLGCCLSDYLCVLALLNTESNLDSSVENENQRMHTTCNIFMELMTFFVRSTDELTDSPLALSLITRYTKATNNLIAIGACTVEFVYEFLKFFRKILTIHDSDLELVKSVFKGIAEANKYFDYYETDHVHAQTDILQAFGFTIKCIAQKDCNLMPSETISDFSSSIEPLLLCLQRTSAHLVEGCIGMILYSALNSLQLHFSDFDSIDSITNIYDFNNICIHLLHSATSVMSKNVLKVIEYNFETIKFNQFEFITTLSLLSLLQIRSSYLNRVVDSGRKYLNDFQHSGIETEMTDKFIEKSEHLLSKLSQFSR